MAAQNKSWSMKYRRVSQFVFHQTLIKDMIERAGSMFGTQQIHRRFWSATQNERHAGTLDRSVLKQTLQ